MTTRPLATLLALAALLAPAGAEDGDAALERAADAAEKLHAMAVRVGHIWTCFQIEGWNATHGDPPARVRELIDGRRIESHGDPWWAFPQDIRRHWVHSDWIGVMLHDSFWRLSHDGRPLHLPVPMAVNSQRSGVAENGRIVAVAELDQGRLGRAPVVRVRLHALPDPGEPVPRRPVVLASVDQSLPPLGHERHRAHLPDELAISIDGSGVAVATDRSIPHAPGVYLYTLSGELLRLKRHFETHADPRAVGPTASWLICRDVMRESMILWTKQGQGPEEIVTIEDYAAGGGIAVVRTAESGLMRVWGGRAQPWQPAGITISERPDLWSIGRWLVIGTGHGAQAPATTDLLGNPLPAIERPYALAFYRWADLSDDADAGPVEVIEMDAVRAEAHSLALLHWSGPQLQILDLRGERPRLQPLAAFSQPIASARSDHHHYRVSLADGEQVIIDRDATELWRAPAAACEVHSRRHALIRRDDRHLLVHLDADPAARREVHLVGLDTMRVEIDSHLRFIRSGRGESRRYWRPDGQPLTDPARVEQLDTLRRFRADNTCGRYYRQHGRLIPKHRGTENAPPSDVWRPIDACRLRRQMLVLDHDQLVYASDRSLKEWSILGPVDGGDTFRLFEGAVHVAFHHRTQRGPEDWPCTWELRARLAEEDTLEAEWITLVEPSRGGGRRDSPYARVGDLPDHNWRLHDRRLRFVIPPKAEERRWDHDTQGWTPLRLRPLRGSAALAITPSLVLRLDRRAMTVLSVMED
ncbi:MAG: hypothetical protein ACOCZK_08335 [Planctomycetota bacterium]